MRRALSFFLLAFLVRGALAAPVDIACYWEKPSTNLNEAEAEAGSFYSKIDDPAYFMFDLEKSTVKNTDKSTTQNLILRDLSISEYGNDVEIRVGTPNIKGIVGIGASLVIRINPYTLRSIMLLTIPSKATKQVEAHWLRSGQCNLRRF